MKKNNLKKLLYLLSLTSMITLSGCNHTNDQIEDTEIEIELNNEETKNCHHLNKNIMTYTTLSDGSKYIKSADIMSAIRYNFLNENSLLVDIEYDGFDIDKITDENKFYGLIDCPEVRKSIILNSGYFNELVDINNYTVMDIIYRENDINNSIYYNSSTDLYNDFYNYDSGFNHSLIIDTNLSNKDITIESVTYDNVNASKHCTISKRDNEYNVEQSYSYVTLDKEDLNKIKIDLKQEYFLDEEMILNGDYSCSDYKGILVLDNIDEQIEVELDEETFNYILSKMIESAVLENPTGQFLEENEELISNLYGDDYQMFIEKTKSISYTLTK